jgi:RNA polymerase sigma factor (sigma-70 family)
MDTANRDLLFQQAVDEHMGIFLKTAHGFASGAADRDDLVQEMLLAAWQALPGCNGRCKLSTFLYRVAHNRALNWQRSRIRYDRKLEHFSQHPQLVIERREPDGQEQKLEWLYAVIRGLPPLDRTLIMLQLDGLSHQEMADVTGFSETNVGVRLHRIKRWLAGQKTQDLHEL